MIAFDIYVNEKHRCTASVGDRGVLSAILSWVKRSGRLEGEPEELNFDVGGIANSTEQSFDSVKWINEELSIGDEIHIRIVEAEIADKPFSRKKSFRVNREARERKLYKRLKMKYQHKFKRMKRRNGQP